MEIRAIDMRCITALGDHLRDGGGGHFAACVAAIRQASPGTRIEILVPDFRGRMDRALGEYLIRGIKTNIPFTQAIIRDPVFREGKATTKYIEEFVKRVSSSWG